MKVCRDSVKKSSESETPQVGFINPGIAMASIDEDKYTRLHRDQVGYQALKHPEYIDVLDAPIFPPHSRFRPRPALPPLPESSIERLDDSGYTLPQIQSSQDIVYSVTGKKLVRRHTLARTASGVYEEIPDDLIGEDVYEDVYDPGYLQPVSQSNRKHESPDGDQKSPDDYESGYLQPVSHSDGTRKSPDGDHKASDPPGSPSLNRKRESYITKL